METGITLASKERTEVVKAFSSMPMQYSKNISNSISTIKQALDVENPIQLSEWMVEAPNQMRAVLIKFIEGTLMFFSFPKDAMPNQQIVMIVNDILEKYYYFRLEDVCLCFKKGRMDSSYRKFYGRLDGSVFLDWFAKYDKEREGVLQSHPSNNQKVDDFINAIPYEKYREMMLKQAEEGDETALESLKKMENVKRMFDENMGVYKNYQYNRKHRLDD
jgi:hypothetical protein